MLSKIKICVAVFLIALLGAFMVGNVTRSTAQTSYCPNGCVADGGGCYCNGWYPSYAEYDWEQET